MEKTFSLRVLIYLLIYNFHFAINEIEFTTILASVYALLIVSSSAYFKKKVILFFLLISMMCLLSGYIQLIPHAIFGAEIGSRITKYRNNYKLIKIILLLFSISNFFIYFNDISKFSSFIGFSQLTVFSHVQALILCLLFSREFLIKQKKFIIIYVISSLLMPVRTLIFLLIILIIINRFKFIFNNISKFFYVLLVLLIFFFKPILNSDILPSSGDSVKFRLAILNQVLSITDFQKSDYKLKNEIWESSGINLSYEEILSFDNTLLTLQSKSYFAFAILIFIILYCKAEIIFLYLILDDYTNGLQFLFLFAIVVSFFNLKKINK